MRTIFAAALTACFLPVAAAAAATSDSCSSVAACVLGANTSSGIGVNGTSTSGFGVEGATSVKATSTGGARAGVYGKDTTNISSERYNSGVAGSSSYGYGGSFSSTHGTGVYVANGGLYVKAYTPTGSGSTGGYADGIGIIVIGGSEPQEGLGNDLFTAVGCIYTPDTRNSCGNVATIDSLGNEVLAGALTENGSPTIVTKNAAGTRLASFAARSASPTIEDFGTAVLQNGVATVTLDKAFASTIAPGFMVFVTPHGDSNGLYTIRSVNGFIVRENKAGRSTLAFDYRIVAKPLDAKVGHLPAVTPLKRFTSITSR